MKSSRPYMPKDDRYGRELMNDSLNAVADALLAASLPIDADTTDDAANLVIEFYKNAPSNIALPAEEVASRFSEMWDLWFVKGGEPSQELRSVIAIAIAVTPEMEELGHEYFEVEKKLEESDYLKRPYSVALIGCAPLIRTLVVEQHLGLDRIRTVVNVPGATVDAIKRVLSGIGVRPAFRSNEIQVVYEGDLNSVSALFGDTPPDEADSAFRGLLGSFLGSSSYGDCVCGLVDIGFEPYLFFLYFELLTLESTDRFPGQAIYECKPRGVNVRPLWNEMYNPNQENPYLNNAKSVYSLDRAWAETKLSNETQNGSLLLANSFEILSELPYTTRRRIARITRSYLVMMANQNQSSTALPRITSQNIRSFVEKVCTSNSLTKGVLDQRLVEFLTLCKYDEADWFPHGVGSSVNESNASGRKYGDVEYYDVNGKREIHAYEAHGGGLRDEYIEEHINSLKGTVDYYRHDAGQRGEEYKREVEIVYVAHDVSRLTKFQNGYSICLEGVRFVFRFVTFWQLLDEVGGMDAAVQQVELFSERIHWRISRLPDTYTLKQRYCELAGIGSTNH